MPTEFPIEDQLKCAERIIDNKSLVQPLIDVIVSRGNNPGLEQELQESINMMTYMEIQNYMNDKRALELAAQQQIMMMNLNPLLMQQFMQQQVDGLGFNEQIVANNDEKQELNMQIERNVERKEEEDRRQAHRKKLIDEYSRTNTEVNIPVLIIM